MGGLLSMTKILGLFYTIQYGVPIPVFLDKNENDKMLSLPEDRLKLLKKTSIQSKKKKKKPSLFKFWWKNHKCIVLVMSTNSFVPKNLDLKTQFGLQ
jgi:hypothetical protein